MARAALIQRTVLHPKDSAIAPPIAGPIAPPRRGASMIRDIGEPLCSDGKISPMIAGLRTLLATANPVKNREKMKMDVDGLKAPSRTEMMKRMFAALKTGYRPNISESGAMKRGPAASPSSQMVTSMIAEDLLS